MTTVVITVLLGLLALSLRSIQPSSDPWTGIMSNEEINDLDQALCTRCQRPVSSSRQHYCPDCGNVTGEFTGYLPFVNIPFSCSLYETLWKKLKLKEGHLAARLFGFLVLLFCAPLILIVGIPVQCYLKLHLSEKENHECTPEI
jgi:hypothetical protein